MSTEPDPNIYRIYTEGARVAAPQLSREDVQAAYDLLDEIHQRIQDGASLESVEAPEESISTLLDAAIICALFICQGAATRDQIRLILAEYDIFLPEGIDLERHCDP